MRTFPHKQRSVKNLRLEFGLFSDIDAVVCGDAMGSSAAAAGGFGPGYHRVFLYAVWAKIRKNTLFL
jgi:hypothetical protein